MAKVVKSAVVGGLVSGAVGFVVGGPAGAAAGFARGFAASFIVGGVSSLLTKSPKAQTISPALAPTKTVRRTLSSRTSQAGSVITVREPASPRQIIYGTTRVGGTIIYMGTSELNKYIHIVVALAGHECEAINTVYFNGIASQNFNQFSRETRYRIVFGGGTTTAVENININISGTPFYGASMDAIVAAIDADNDFQAVKTSWRSLEIFGETPDITFSIVSSTATALVPGQLPHYNTAGSVSSLTSYSPVFRINKHLGTSTQTADTDLVAEVSEWGTTDRLRGICYVYVRLLRSNEAWQGSIPNITADVQGKNDIYYPTTQTNIYSNNAALCVANFLTDPVYGYGADYSSEIDNTELIAAMNVCFETVNLNPTGTEQRYNANGSFNTDNTLSEILQNLTGAMAGHVAYVGGVFKIRAGAYPTPGGNLDEETASGPIQVSARQSRSNLFNAVKGTYISSKNKHQPADFPPLVSTAYATQDGGETIFRDISLPFTSSSSTAQRIAKAALFAARQQITVSQRFNLTAIQYQAGDVIRLSNTRMGWTNKDFEITKLALVVEESGEIAVDLMMRETVSTVWDWLSSEEDIVDDAPDTNLPDPFDVTPPINFTAESGSDTALITKDGTVINRVKLQWESADLFASRFKVEYKQVLGGTEWIYAGVARVETYFISNIEDGVNYSFRVAAINDIGAISNWTYIYNHVVDGYTLPPSDVSTFLVNRHSDGTRVFSWTMADIPDNLAGYVIRAKSGTGHSWEDMDPLHSGYLVSSPYETYALAAGTYTAGIKAIDTSGNFSETALIIQSTLGDPRLGTAAILRDLRALEWPGTKTDCFVDNNGFLMPIGTQDWTDLPATWADWHSWHNNDWEDPIIYEDDVIDLGAVINFTPIAGAYVAGANPTIQERHSDDDITYTSYATSGSPITARYVQLKFTASSVGAFGFQDGAIHIDLQAKQEILDDFDTSDVSSPAGDFRVPLTETYAIITKVSLALQNVGAGWSWEVIDKNVSTGPRIKIYNSSSTLADATVDIDVRGF